jgi:hypothetical protein
LNKAAKKKRSNAKIVLTAVFEQPSIKSSGSKNSPDALSKGNTDMEYSLVASETFTAWSRIPPRGGAIIETAGTDLEAARKFWRASVKLAPAGIIIRLLDETDFCHEANI